MFHYIIQWLSVTKISPANQLLSKKNAGSQWSGLGAKPSAMVHARRRLNLAIWLQQTQKKGSPIELQEPVFLFGLLILLIVNQTLRVPKFSQRLLIFHSKIHQQKHKTIVNTYHNTSSQPDLRSWIPLGKKSSNHGPGLPRRVPWRVLWENAGPVNALGASANLDSPCSARPEVNLSMSVWTHIFYVSEAKEINDHKCNLGSWNVRNQKNNEQK